MDGFKNSPGEFFRLPFQHFNVFPVNLVTFAPYGVLSDSTFGAVSGGFVFAESFLKLPGRLAYINCVTI